MWRSHMRNVMPKIGESSFNANIAKVESRGKIYFHYARTKRIYVLFFIFPKK